MKGRGKILRPRKQIRLRIPCRLHDHIPLDQRSEAPADVGNRRVGKIIIPAPQRDPRHVGQSPGHARRFQRKGRLPILLKILRRRGSGQQSFLFRGKNNLAFFVQDKIDAPVPDRIDRNLPIQGGDIVGDAGHTREAVFVVIRRDAGNAGIPLHPDINVCEYGPPGRLDFLIPRAFSRIEGRRVPGIKKLYELLPFRHDVRADDISALRGVEASHLVAIVIALCPKRQIIRRVGRDLRFRQDVRNPAAFAKRRDEKKIRFLGSYGNFSAQRQLTRQIKLPTGQDLRHRLSKKIRIFPKPPYLVIDAASLFFRHEGEPLFGLLVSNLLRERGGGSPHFPAAFDGMLLHIVHSQERNRLKSSKARKPRQKHQEKNAPLDAHPAVQMKSSRLDSRDLSHYITSMPIPANRYNSACPRARFS